MEAPKKRVKQTYGKLELPGFEISTLGGGLPEGDGVRAIPGSLLVGQGL